VSFGIVRFSKFGNFLEISGFFELAKILRKYFGNKFRNNFLFLGQKNLFLRVLGSKFKKQGQKQGFPNIPNLRKIQNLFFSELSENYQKMMLKSNFGNREKLIPTRKPTRMFGLKFGM